MRELQQQYEASSRMTQAQHDPATHLAGGAHIARKWLITPTIFFFSRQLSEKGRQRRLTPLEPQFRLGTKLLEI